ncbi:hypothetical protein G1C98_1598 [Bifidobacterium sp. DSM 109960]|uniref:BIG2 domain-containing protein n=1 Tax=Bifidobacterium erythrocebi TaxID=2675325 RepID=A0A7Y0EUV3_9BIFI|nr:SpaA isopeptide-forming pilin-related protein [Bifidobacterium sp. DSM 109960]NMM96862.1 hypothetical protein [Bifidobacterium sp. DSM 109960]
MPANASQPLRRRVRSLCAAIIAFGVTASLIAAPALAANAISTLANDGTVTTANEQTTTGLCTGKTMPLGPSTGSSTVDDGIATYVGGNMYVGKKNDHMMSTNGPDGSYAVEAEGLTAVKGKLLLHPIKNAWAEYDKNGKATNYKGFRFGVVGFGANFRPKEGQSVLEVRGDSTDTGLSDANSVQAWGNAGWIGKMEDDDKSYIANIAGATTTLWGGTSNDFYGKRSGNVNKIRWNQRISVYDYSKSPTGTTVDKSNVKYGKTDDSIGSTGETFMGFGETIKTMSKNMVTVGQGSTDPSDTNRYIGTVTTGTYNGNLERHKFDYETNKKTYTFTASSVSEKLITFTGNGKAALQVFNVPASDLSGNQGISYKFVNIPDTASVVINVTGSTVSFHNGWRFFWGDNNTDIGGEYTSNDYAKHAQQIMWNFADAQSLTIYGGQAQGHMTVTPTLDEQTSEGIWSQANLTMTDDSAAGFLGSILVPNGSFESHVSTNGRVWVGGDFSMYNPTTVEQNGTPIVNIERSHTASAIDMDQERHNLPWNGSYTAQCATLAWDKVQDDTSHTLLAGTTWAVYGSLEAAKSNDPTQALKRITDGQYGDEDNQNDGHFEVSGLNPSDSTATLTYYLREVATNDTQHRLNSNIYAINAGMEGVTARKITKVYDSNGTEITDVSKKLLVTTQSAGTNDQIINESKGIELSWSKVDKDATGKTLAGSVWKLQRQGSSVAYHITDTTKSAAKVTIKYNGKDVASIDLKTTDIADLTAEVTDAHGSTDGLPQRVAWTSSNAGAATVNADSGLVTPIAAGTTTIKACSVMDVTKCASMTVTVTGESRPETKATTTVYYPKSVFGENTTPSFQYSLDGGTTWVKGLSMEASGCNEWWKITFSNPDKKAIEFDVYSSNGLWDNNNKDPHNYSHDYAAELTLSGSVNYDSYISAGTLTNGMPSGCSITPPTTQETVRIINPSTTSISMNKGETRTLAADKTPSNTTLTWSSGNTSVATVTAKGSDSSTDTTATLKALAVGKATIRVRTAGGATASITVTVRDGSQLTVYFKTGAVNNSWGEYWLAYQQKSNGNYATAKMTQAVCNSEYVVATIPRDQVQENYGYYFRDNGRLDNNRRWYGSNGVDPNGDVFQFPGGSYTSLRVESNSTKQTSAPSGCEASNARSTAKSAAKTRAKATAKKSAQTTTKTTTQAAAQATAQQRKSAQGTAVQSGEGGTSAAGAAVTADNTGSTGSTSTTGDTATETIYSCGDTNGRCDMDATVGGFRIVDLEAGTYTLTEVVEPNGFAGTAASYTVTIKADGSTTWDPALQSGSTSGVNKVPNTRMTGTVTWNKVTKVKQTAGGSEQTVKLGGTEWSITKVKSFAWGADGKATYSQIADADKVAHAITDCVNGQSTDAQGAVINDCSTQLATEATPYVDMDGAAGQFTVTGLGWGVYELKESTAPEGYTVDATTRTFTFGPAEGADTTGQWYQNTVGDADGTTAGTTTGATGTTAGATISTKQVDYDQQVFMFAIGDIANARTLGTVTWQKVGSDDETKLLAGSQWRLVQKAAYDTAEGVYVKLANEQTYDVIDCTTSGMQSLCGTGANTGTDGKNTWNDSDPTPGKFTLRQLPWGEYTLVETAAPRGYTPKAEETAFTVGPTKAETGDAAHNQTSSGAMQRVNLVIGLGGIVNQKTVIATAIPMTGGDWTGRDILAVGGGLALLAGICAMARKHSRRKAIPHAQPRL